MLDDEKQEQRLRSPLEHENIKSSIPESIVSILTELEAHDAKEWVDSNQK